MLKDIRPALRAFLLADNAISTRVGGRRIFPTLMPQGISATSLVYNRISGIGDHHMAGPSGYTAARIQIAAWAQVNDAAEELANLVKERLDGFRGLMESTTSPALFPPVRVQGAFYDSDNPPTYDEARKLYGVGRDYMIHYAER